MDLWYRPAPDRAWRWYYIDHQSPHLWWGRLKHDKDLDRAAVYVDLMRVGAFDGRGGTLQFENDTRLSEGHADFNAPFAE